MAIDKDTALIRIPPQFTAVQDLMKIYFDMIDKGVAQSQGGEERLTMHLYHLSRVLSRASVVAQDAAYVLDGGQLPDYKL